MKVVVIFFYLYIFDINYKIIKKKKKIIGKIMYKFIYIILENSYIYV